MQFKKAVRSQVKLKLALTGPSGSGKTFSSLRLAKGLGGKIAVIDTESGSASLYSDKFDFDVLEIAPPFATHKYIEAIDFAIKSGYDILIIDSLSHAWAGEGGLLAQKEQLDSRGGNSYTNWGRITKLQEEFVAKILHSRIHMICTMRSKQEYAMTQDSNNKTKIQKLGMAPIQRDGLEYEMTTVFDLSMTNEAEVSKDRTNLWKGIFKITEETGQKFMKWLESGAPEKKEEEKFFHEEPLATASLTKHVTNEMIALANEEEKKKNDDRKSQVFFMTDPKVRRLYDVCKEHEWSKEQLLKFIRNNWDWDNVKGMNEWQYDLLMVHIKSGGSPTSVLNPPPPEDLFDDKAPVPF